jgi:hypothetical protein
MYDIEEAKRINDYLKLQEHNIKGEPIFRLVWAEDQFEMREGTFNEFKGELFVRTVYGVKRTPKYPYVKGCWVLEQYFSPEVTQIKEIKDHNGYEAIYTFIHKFQPLQLRLRVVELIMKAKHEARKSSMLSKSLLQNYLDDKEKKADDYTYNAIDSPSAMEMSLRLGDGVSLYIKEKNATKSETRDAYTSKSGK